MFQSSFVLLECGDARPVVPLLARPGGQRPARAHTSWQLLCAATWYRRTKSMEIGPLGTALGHRWEGLRHKRCGGVGIR